MGNTDSAVSLEIPEDMRDFVDDFLVEADDLISSLDNDLVALESSPGDLELLNRIFRAAHTIKGNSSFLSLDQVTDLTHNMEDVLNRLRKEEIVVTSHIMDVLLKSLDGLKLLLEDVRSGKLVQRDFKSVIAKLVEINEVESSEEISSVSDGTSSEPEAVPTSTASPAETTKSKPVERKKEQTIRVDVNRLDSLMNLVGELVLGRNSLLQVSSRIATTGFDSDSHERVTATSSQINFVTTELQAAVMNLRMLPVGKVFNRFPRMVRDLASSTNKKINLEIFGEDTELDKTVIEEIGDPLVHLVRNSCDHGIGTPEERIAAGKPETGKVVLGAAQQGSHIVVTIEDDGRGLDAEKLGKKALEKGLTTETELSRMSKQAIFQFIFHAGFSTAASITDISGRGVGMDVVRSNIEKLNGIIELDSELGRGTKICIKLPLTLAIIQGLLVKAGDDIYIVPLASVLETVKVSRKEVSVVNGVDVISLRDSALPILPLRKVFSQRPCGAECDWEKSYVVVIGLADRRLGLLVDDLLGQEEVVIKSLGQLFGNIEGLAGATILGDGRIRLIADVAGLFNLASTAAHM